MGMAINRTFIRATKSSVNSQGSNRWEEMKRSKEYKIRENQPSCRLSKYKTF